MKRTSNVFARVEPEVKTRAEAILDQLGIPMSNAIGIFLRQIILHNGIPFEVRLPAEMPPDYSKLTDTAFNESISAGLRSLESGDVYTDAEMAAEMKKEYGV